MAWIRKPGEETEDQPIVSGQGSGTLGISSSGTTGQSGPQRGTGFSDLQKYLDANKGAAAGLGEKVSSRLSKEGQDVTTAQQEAESGLESALKPIESTNIQSLTSKYVDPIFNAPNSLRNVAGATEKNTVQPDAYRKYYESLNPSGNELSTLMSSKGQYSGPQSVDYGQAKTEATEAELLGKNAETEAGRFNMLRDLVKNRPVRSGNINLDQAILQTDPTAIQGVTETAKGLQGLTGKLTDAETANTSRITSAKEKAASDYNALKDTLGSKMATSNKYVSDKQKTLDYQAAHPEIYGKQGTLNWANERDKAWMNSTKAQQAALQRLMGN